MGLKKASEPRKKFDRKSVKILLGLNDSGFLKKVATVLRRFYTVYSAVDIRDFSEKVHAHDPDLIVVDDHFSHMKAEDLYQGIEFLHPNAVFVIYANKAKLQLVKSIWKRRALDYIYHTSKVLDFMEDIHKVVRYVIEKKARIRLEAELAQLRDQMTKSRRRPRVRVVSG